MIIKQNIAEIPCDAVVNATNTHLIPGGHGVDAAIHAAAGPGLLKECMKAGHVDIGGACITDAYSLPCKKIIHTAGPAWNSGSKGEIALLKSCYESALALCEEFGFESVAFPLISSGAMGFPRELVLKLAVECITAHLDSLGEERELTVFIAVPDTSVYSVPDETERQLKSYLSSFEYRPLCEISAQRSPARSKKTFGLKKSDKKTAAGNAAIPKPHKTEDLALAEQIADYAPSYALELQSDDRMTEEDCALPRDGIPEDGNERRQ
ncbi:MAG: macro domain-containing protein [Clostridia bacterium]|nr:macro domain-containing protein [Clostridia bacterium]